MQNKEMLPRDDAVRYMLYKKIQTQRTNITKPFEQLERFKSNLRFTS